MSRRPGVRVLLYAGTEPLGITAAQMMRRLGGAAARLIVLKLPRLFEALGPANANGTSMKRLRLISWARRLRECDALVTAERTSTLLKRLPGQCPPLIHIRHGAGDQPPGFERRIALFDELIVAGTKDRDRTVAAGLLPPERCHVCGYMKLAGVRRLHAQRPALFANGRPTVLYNPHFKSWLSSWHHARAIVDGIRTSQRFNLIVAPHVRLFADAPRSAWAEWEALQVPGQIIVDLGSPRSVDMTYTMASDIYLGDVSSQVYEFAVNPRPCVFVNAHGANWRDNPDYRMWQMGEVVTDAEQIVPALLRATREHTRYADTQRRLVRDALGDVEADGTARAVQVILNAQPPAAWPTRDPRAYPRR